MAELEKTLRVGVPKLDPEVIRSPETLSDLVHKVGHEIGNPLTAIISLASIIERFHQDPSTPETAPPLRKTSSYAASIIDEAWKISALSERMVLLLSQKPGNTEPCNLFASLERSIQRMRSRSRELSHEVVKQRFGDCEPLVDVDGEQLQVLLQELVSNAQNALTYEFSPDRAPASPITAFVKADATTTTLIISNDIPAPRPVALDDLFNPFVTTQPDHKHLGLGLTVCWIIAQRFGGAMRVIEQPRGDELTFTVELSFPTAKMEEV